MNKIFYLILFSFLLGSSLSINAQSDNGTWKIHTVFNDQRSKVVDSGDRIYCLTDNYLNAYNKATGAFENLTKLDRLSDNYVSNIYYNPAKNYLVVTYTNYNLDILLADGTTINIPNIKDLSKMSDNTINDVTFGDNKIYVAFKTGYIIVNDNNFCVEKAAVLDTNVKSIAEVGEIVLIATDSKVYYSDVDYNFKNINQTSATSLSITGTIVPISENTFFLNTTSKLYVVTTSTAKTFSATAVSSAKVVDIQATPTGFLAVGGSTTLSTNKFYTFDSDGNKTAEVSLPTALTNTLLTTQESDGSLWRLGVKGLQHVTFDTTTSTVTSLSDELAPNCVTVKRVGEMEYNKKNKKIYVTNGNSTYNGFNRGYSKTAYISSFDGSSWQNEMPTDLKGYKIQDPGDPVFDPNDPETFYIGTWFQGVYKIKNNEILARYDWNNSPLIQNWICCVPGIQFDSEGNLWIVQFPNKAKERNIFMLPKENLNKTDVTIDDWKTFEFELKNTNQNTKFLISKDNYKFISGGGYQYPVHFIDNSNIDNTPKGYITDFLVDEDNKKVRLDNILDVKEDKSGKVWIIHAKGILCYNPAESVLPNFKVTHPKDKDNPTKYILDNVLATCMTIDDENRKWVGSMSHGVYLLNAECTQVLKHFTTSNSCISSNTIQSICWNSNTKSVFIGLNGGLYEYTPENINDYSNLMVTPNRITPDFNGQIAISNVPLNSIVYIKDAEGNTVKTLQANATTIYWNGHHDNGKQAKTGRYSIAVKLSNENNERNDIITFSVIR